MNNIKKFNELNKKVLENWEEAISLEPMLGEMTALSTKFKEKLDKMDIDNTDKIDNYLISINASIDRIFDEIHYHKQSNTPIPPDDEDWGDYLKRTGITNKL